LELSNIEHPANTSAAAETPVKMMVFIVTPRESGKRDSSTPRDRGAFRDIARGERRSEFRLVLMAQIAGGWAARNRRRFEP
jgi:hypothetical protein